MMMWKQGETERSGQITFFFFPSIYGPNSVILKFIKQVLFQISKVFIFAIWKAPLEWWNQGNKAVKELLINELRGT